MADTYVVVRGDALERIAKLKYEQYGYDRWQDYQKYLVELNDIEDPDFIVIGQVLKLTGTATKTTNKTSTPTIRTFGLLSNGTTLYASWKWDKPSTDRYEVKWYYKDPKISEWISGSATTTTDKQATYSVPDGATQVKFKVRPVAQTRERNGTTVARWTANWSTDKIFHYAPPPETPPVPTISVDQFKVTVSVANVDADKITFQFVRDDTSIAGKTTVKVVTNSATFTLSAPYSGSYKVRCQAIKNDQTSEWSNYSSNVYTAPSAPSSITDIRAESRTSVYLAWGSSKNATSYEIEYATDKKYFDGSDNTTTVSSVDNTAHRLITDLESGKEYFFRVRAVRGDQKSKWCAVQSAILGAKPIAPTTWSSTTTAIVGEPITLFWVHNSEDGSNERYAEIELIVDGEPVPLQPIANPNLEKEEAGEGAQTRSYILDTGYYEGSKILWRVRTSGILSEFGDWSIQRTIDVYAQPTLEFELRDAEGNVFVSEDSTGDLTRFPFSAYALPGPDSQSPIGYYLSVTANQAYETADAVGNDVYIRAGDQVYSKYFDVGEQSLEVSFSAGDIDLENNVSYQVKCTVAMNSGLTVEKAGTFTVAWQEVEYEPNAEIGIDEDSVSATIRPYCEDEEGNPIEGVTLAVYRREFDGKFTEIMSGIDNTVGTYVTDPHPALDYARYRIVATDNATGSVSYCDIAPFPVGEKAAIIQWAEDWSTFEGDNENSYEQPNWTGSLLRLPYNIDVSDSAKADVALVEYIGRAHPTSYYGTQIGHTSTWNVDIEKSDEETIYALRRLQNWMGDVYVREPSGSGYWANLAVSFNQKHKEVTIPVTLNITRVEGGV